MSFDEILDLTVMFFQLFCNSQREATAVVTIYFEVYPVVPGTP